MAAPPEVNILDLSGTYIMNKTLSDDTDKILALQGIGWAKRRIIRMLTITLYVKHYKDDEGKEHVDIYQAAGSVDENFEQRTLDWTERAVEDKTFGPVVGKSRKIKVEDIEDDWQKDGWLSDTLEQGAIEAHTESDTPKSGRTWIANQVWGFAEINGERKYTRKVHFVGPQGEDIKAVLVYDYLTWSAVLVMTTIFSEKPSPVSVPEHALASDLQIATAPLSSGVYGRGGIQKRLETVANETGSLDPVSPIHSLLRTPSALKERLLKRARSKCPLLYHYARITVNYVRGPTPKVDLSDPVPILGRSFSLRGRSLTLAFEPTILQWSRPFTSKWLLAFLVAAYIISLSFLTRAQYYLTRSDAWIGCTSTYWLANDGCGLDGQSCAPFDNSSLDFRCPAQCTSVVLANPRTIGDIQVDGVPLIVGGGDENQTYRGDSFICSAAVHAGLFKDSTGGCGSLDLIGNFTDFLSLTAHGLTSAPFPTVFPLSFRYGLNTSLSHCADLRDYALAFNIIVTALLFILLRPKPIILYWSLICIGFWHVSLFSQPQDYPPPLDVAFGAFLPTLFVAYAFWRLAFRFVLPTFSKAPIERSVWYLAAFWPGVLLNIVTEKIPIDRLVASDIDGNKGALTAVIILAVAVFVIVVNQVRVIRKTGWLPHYLAWYIAGGLVALVLSQLPNLQLRLHHYIFAMVMIPGTAFPTRLSAIYQSFLLGMFLNGIAAFGFDSILQTAADLRRDAAQGTLLPSFLTNSTTYNSSIPLSNQTIFWDAIQDSDDGWNGFALLVDDVERYTGTALNFSLAVLQGGTPHFFRLAFQSDGTSGDFTKAATLWPNGTWVDPLPGPS
ncbi:hypothetical protein M0805_003372 [Coniferiporia weirii]|nr:hypothetical protein M0805_003372 [Coniferiporia weirii]